MSISSILPEFVKAILKGVDRGCVDYILRKTVPSINHTLTEKILPDTETRSVDDKLETVSTKVIHTICKTEELLGIYVFFA